MRFFSALEIKLKGFLPLGWGGEPNHTVFLRSRFLFGRLPYRGLCFGVEVNLWAHDFLGSRFLLVAVLVKICFSGVIGAHTFFTGKEGRPPLSLEF